MMTVYADDDIEPQSARRGGGTSFISLGFGNSVSTQGGIAKRIPPPSAAQRITPSANPLYELAST
jgi:hypothetical protein